MNNSVSLNELIHRKSYYKTETYTQREVIDAINHLQLVNIVQTLPTEDIRDNQLYLVLNNENLDAELHNRYDLFVYVNNDWEHIDSFEFDVEAYYTKSEVDNKLFLKSDDGHGHNNVTTNVDGFMSYVDKLKLDGIENEANKILVDDTPTLNSTNAVSSGGVYSQLSGKAPKNHASTGTSYGLATSTKYGHVKSSNSLPLMDNGEGSIGTDNAIYALADHIHPTDTSRASTSPATSLSAGLMSANDKTKLDSIDLTDYCTQNQVESMINEVILEDIQLTIDSSVTSNSTNPVTSKGIKTYVDNAVSNVTITDEDLITKLNTIVVNMNNIS